MDDPEPRPHPRRAAGRWRRRLLALALLALLVLLWTGLVFWQTYEPRVRELPTLVRHQLSAQGGAYAPLDAIAPAVRDAVVAAEDRTFYTNVGVSWTGLGRAFLVDLLSLDYVEGGSTITQQLARSALLSNERTLRRKLKEILLALMITREFPKDRILEMYLNDVYFGHGAYGIEEASETYFAKPASSLTLAQSALLAGIVQGPSLYDPFCNLEGARRRQRYVLDQMEAAGAISAEERNAALSAPLYLVPGTCLPSARAGFRPAG